MLIIKEKRGNAWTNFYLDKFVSSDFVSVETSRNIPEKKLAGKLVDDILSVHGVQDCFVERYIVSVKRTLAVDWESIVPKVEELIRAAVAARYSGEI